MVITSPLAVAELGVSLRAATHTGSTTQAVAARVALAVERLGGA
jgi:hypothetical protein